ncbi:SGNH/GDSL hydrolase family protein [Streptomyces sp. NPDC089919]|uniref:SGNH/GDSL hydrolase family protein n=1 Tax=Streptomyces sp. NPDC089919 TaxID=3155188 RepID=UPI0034288DCF
MTPPRPGHPPRPARPPRSSRRPARLRALGALAALATAGVLTAAFAGGGSDPDGPGPAARPPADARTAGPVDRGGPIAVHWVAAWSAAPVGPEPDTDRYGQSGRTFRNVVHTGIAGDQVRITLSNRYGRSPLRITAATAGLAAGPATPAAADGSLVRLTFRGSPVVTVPPGGQVTSDPQRLRVRAGADLLISTYAPASDEPGGPVTYHPGARQTSYAREGDGTEDATGDSFTDKTGAWRQLVAVDLRTNKVTGTVVAFGDSLTDGAFSSMDDNHRWPDFLSTRLRQAAAEASRTPAGPAGTAPADPTGTAPRLGVVNAGISGNRLLADGTGPRGLDRFDRDVLARPGARVVVIALGINDILKSDRPADPDRITEGLLELAARARARGLLVAGATLTPYAGHKGWSAEQDSVRRAVNARIRAGEVFDVVVDFDRALRDPADPARLQPAFDSGDHLHPNDLGYRAMAGAVDLPALM